MVFPQRNRKEREREREMDWEWKNSHPRTQNSQPSKHWNHLSVLNLFPRGLLGFQPPRDLRTAPIANDSGCLSRARRTHADSSQYVAFASLPSPLSPVAIIKSSQLFYSRLSHVRMGGPKERDLEAIQFDSDSPKVPGELQFPLGFSAAG